MLNRKVVQVEGWGELHVIEPELEEIQPMLTKMRDNQGTFGMELLKICVHYPDGRRVFAEKVGFAKGKALLTLVGDCVEVCGLAGEPDAREQAGVLSGGEVSQAPV